MLHVQLERKLDSAHPEQRSDDNWQCFLGLIGLLIQLKQLLRLLELRVRSSSLLQGLFSARLRHN